MPTNPAEKLIRDRPDPMGEVPVVYPLKAIRSMCLQCVEGPKDVRDCCSTVCPLWPYRFGKSYSKALREGLTVDPNSEAGHVLRDQYRSKPKGA